MHQSRQSRLQRHQLCDSLGVKQAEVHSHIGPEAMTHQGGTLDSHFVQEATQVFGHVRRGITARGDIAVAVTAEIVSSNAVLAAKDGRHIKMPDREITEEAV